MFNDLGNQNLRNMTYLKISAALNMKKTTENIWLSPILEI
jgi:hypothetical protein